MVRCESESGFVLGAAAAARAGSERRAPSVSSSLYKQHIDALFDSASRGRSLEPPSKVTSARDRSRPPAEDDDYCRTRISSMSNAVQQRIERMFAELAGEAAATSAFSAHYLGCTPLRHKVSSLGGLQAPLRELFFAHRRSSRRAALAGRIEISPAGLRVRDRGDVDQLNPFPTIAVWSAVKFAVQPLEADSARPGCAFLPLITDPDAVDRQALFRPLEAAERRLVLARDRTAPEPLFAVVMRKTGAARRLECHAFLCQSSEDAIVIAATLYKSLMAHMSRRGPDAPHRSRLENRNGVSCMSVASSVEPPTRPPRTRRPASSLSGDSDRADGFSAPESFAEKPERKRTERLSSDRLPPPPPPPTVPPPDLRRITVEEVKAKLDAIKGPDTSGSDTHPSNASADSIEARATRGPPKAASRPSGSESSVRSKISEKIELFRQLERRRNVTRPPSPPPPVPSQLPSPQLARPATPAPSGHAPLRRNHSGRKSLSDSGDILTKVAIPRSGSFLNAGGLTRYKSLGHRNNGKKGGGSPLGFNELFNEFKVQENLHSMDEILNTIIDAEGMSFNDLKPIYKEFLLKLAVTLTKDEIFQHSKAIMKKQKKKILRRSSIFQNKRRKILKSASGLRMVFRLPFGKESRKKERKKGPDSFDFHDVTNSKNLLISESSVSTSSYDLRQFCPKEPAVPAPRRPSVRQRTSTRSDKIVHVSKRSGKVHRIGERTSSEDSDFLTLSNRLGGQNRNSSSGYVSCSECESESCVDRCYCSLKGDCKNKCYCSAADYKNDQCPKTRLKPKSKSCKDCFKSDRFNDEPSYCSCDSESCAESTRCYCAAASRLPERRASSQRPADRSRRAFDNFDANKDAMRNRWGTSSVGGGRRRSRSSDSLALDYELLLQNRVRDARRTTRRLTVRSTGGGSQQALSVKKSAEMAALFADVRLSQRTDVRALMPPQLSLRPSLPRAHKPLSRNASLEDTLGYLP